MELAKAYVQIIPSAEGITDNLTSVLDPGATSAGQSAGQKISSGFRSAIGGVAKVGATAFAAVGSAAVAATGAFVSGAGSVAEYGDHIDKMSQKMGMSAESYQEWDAVMKHSGTSMETMKASMKTLASAAETDSAAFEKLGISHEQLQSMSQEELFEATITALQNVDSETERTYLAGKVLGRGATELGALLNTSAEDTQAMRDRVHELGGVMSDEAVKSAAAYQDSLQDMTTAFSGLKNSMMAEFLPSITTVMNGLTEIFSGNSEQGIGMVTEGINGLLSSIGEAIPQISAIALEIITALAQTFIANLPQIVEVGLQIIGSLAGAIIENLPLIMEAIVGVGDVIINTLIEYGPMLLEQGMSMLASLATGIVEGTPQALDGISETIGGILDYITENLPVFLDQGVEFITQMAAGIFENMPAIIETMGEIITNLIDFIVENIPMFMEKGIEILQGIGQGFMDNLPGIITTTVKVLAEIIASIAEHLPEFLQKGIELIAELGVGLIQAIPDLLAMLPQIFNDVSAELASYDWIGIGINLIEGIVDGVVSAAGNLATAAVNAVIDAWNSMVSWLDIASPSKKARDIIGKNWSLGIGVGFEEGMPVSDMVGKVKDTVEDLSALKPEVEFGAVVNSAKWNAPEMPKEEKGCANLSEILGDIKELLEELKGLAIVLDSGATIGQLLPGIDRGLGVLAARKGRG